MNTKKTAFCRFLKSETFSLIIVAALLLTTLAHASSNEKNSGALLDLGADISNFVSWLTGVFKLTGKVTDNSTTPMCPSLTCNLGQYCQVINGQVHWLDCPSGTICREGACVCRTAGECNPTDNTQYCQTINTTWATCPSGQICSPTAGPSGTGGCVTSCSAEGQCNPENSAEKCIGGIWRACSTGLTCYNGVCDDFTVQCATPDMCNPLNSNQYCNRATMRWTNCSANEICTGGACRPNPTAQSTSTTSAASASAPASTQLTNASQTATNTTAECTGIRCNPDDDGQICTNGQWIDCPSGVTCTGGVCVVTVETPQVNQSRDQEAQQPENNEEIGENSENDERGETPAESEATTSELPEIPARNNTCDGCFVDNSCVSIGYRTNSQYCGLNNTLTLQKGAAEACQNSFECTSNLCAANQCVSFNLFEQIIAWFKKMFLT